MGSFAWLISATNPVSAQYEDLEGCTFSFKREVSQDGWITAGIAPGGEFLAVVSAGECDDVGNNEYFVYYPQTKYRFALNGNSPPYVTVNGSDIDSSNSSSVNGYMSDNAVAATNEGDQLTITNAGVARAFFNVAANAPDPDVPDMDVDADPDTVPGADAETEPEVDDSCEAHGEAMGWIGCPIVMMLDGALTWLDSTIQQMLEVDEDKYTNPDLKRAWVNFRNVAYIILIPVMLVMVIGTALGFEAFSAYTVKRALPRMVIAVIFITFSWYITSFLINFFNVIGGGILGLMTAPFDIPGNLSIGTLFDDGAAGTGLQWGTTAVGVGALAFLGYFIVATGGVGLIIILLYLVPVVGFIFIAYMVLLLRQLFILALVLMAPLAILAWIFPGNDKLWKAWWNLFSKLLMMFPLIMAILGSGRIFAHLINVSDGEGLEALAAPLFKLTAYVLPYLFIPFTFRFAGGLFANLAGMVNDRGKGLFDRSRNARRGMQKQVHEDAMNAKGRFGDGKSGSLYRRAVKFGRDGSFGLTSAQRSRWKENEQRIKEHTSDEMLEAGGNRGLSDDDASALLVKEGMTKSKFIQEYANKLIADGRFTDSKEATTEAERALARSELALGAKVGTDTMQIAALKYRIAMTNTGYDPGEVGLTQMQNEIAALRDKGKITAVDAAGWMKSNRGRADYAANGFVDTIRFTSGKATAAEQIAGAFRGADPREILGGHQRAVETFARQAQVNLDTALASGNQPEVDKALADVANIYDMLSNVSAKKADEFADNVMSRGVLQMPVWDPAGNAVIDPSTGRQQMRAANTTVRALMNEAKGRAAGPNGQQTFLDRRREFTDAERKIRQNQETPEE